MVERNVADAPSLTTDVGHSIEMKLLVVISLVLLSGCVCLLPERDYYGEQLDADEAKLLVRTLKDLHEPPLWTVHHHQDSGYGVYRLTIIASLRSAACAIVQLRETGDATLRIKLCGMDLREVRHTLRGSLKPPPQDLVFDDSRLLSWDEFTTTPFEWLQYVTPLKLPSGLQSLSANLDGTQFFFEAYEGEGHYRVIPICDPAPLDASSRALLKQCYPDIDMDTIENYIDDYLEVLQWFAKATSLRALEEYRDLPNQSTQAIGTTLPLPGR
jgi:hypothetical protein